MENGRSENLIRIKKSLIWLYSQPDGIIANYSDAAENLIVVKEGNTIALHFMDTKTLMIKSKISDPMSTIDISNPLNLLGKYAQAMMLSLVFKGQPKNVYMLGFGGGRVPMVFHHYFSDLIVESSEISEGVLQLAEICFGIIPDDRMKITLQDGREHLQTFPENHFDIILLDSFSGVGDHPNHLSTVEFYQLCKSRLVDDGVVVTNLIDNNPFYQQKVATFFSVFKFGYEYDNDGVMIFFASDVDGFSSEKFQQKAAEIATQYEFEFSYSENSQYITACNNNDEAGAGLILLDDSL